MKILVLSNIYPPYFIGGYELGCRNVVEALIERGHNVRVLTSTYGINRELVQPPIYRLLGIDFDRLPSFLTVVRKETKNQRHFRRLCAEFAPDIVFCWNMSNISLSITAIAADLQIPVRYYLFDNWLATCEMDQWFQYCRSLAPLKPLLRVLLPQFRFLVPGDPCPLDGAIFASSYLKDVAHLMGKDISGAPVVRWGVLAPAMLEAAHHSPASMLYVGQVVSIKGVHTVVEAVGIMKEEHGVSVSLTVVGDIGFDPEYVRQLEDLVERYCISDRVRFTGKVAPEEVGGYLNSHGLFVFPSAWDEPFGISQVEAMAAGMIVLGTATGGSAEIIEDGVNGLRFEREDCRDCARQILRLLEDPELCSRLRAGARASVVVNFNFNRVVDDLEHLLELGRLTATSCMAGFGRIMTGTAPVTEAEAGDLVRSATVVFHKVFSTLILVCARLGGVKVTTEPITAGMTLFIVPGDASDLILALPFLREYAERFPDRKFVVVARPEVVPLMASFPGINEVISFPVTAPAGWRQMTRGHHIWWRYGERLTALLSGKVGTAVSLGWRKDATGAAGATVLSALKVGRRIGFRDAGDGFGRRILDFFVADGPTRRYPWSGLAAMSAIFASLGVTVGSDPLAAVQTGVDVLPDEVAHFIRSAPGPVVAIAPGGDSLCCWPVERYAEVGKWLQTECGASLLILGLRSDLRQCRELHRQLPAGRKLLFTGTMSADELFATLFGAAVVFGNDNCFFYAAVLAGRPAVGVFGPTLNDRLELMAGRQQILRVSIPCSPCGCDCLYDRPRCLDGVDVDRVERAVRGRVFAEHSGDILLSHKEVGSVEPGYTPPCKED